MTICSDYIRVYVEFPSSSQCFAQIISKLAKKCTQRRNWEDLDEAFENTIRIISGQNAGETSELCKDLKM